MNLISGFMISYSWDVWPSELKSQTVRSLVYVIYDISVLKTWTSVTKQTEMAHIWLLMFYSVETQGHPCVRWSFSIPPPPPPPSSSSSAASPMTERLHIHGFTPILSLLCSPMLRTMRTISTVQVHVCRGRARVSSNGVLSPLWLISAV